MGLTRNSYTPFLLVSHTDSLGLPTRSSPGPLHTWVLNVLNFTFGCVYLMLPLHHVLCWEVLSLFGVGQGHSVAHRFSARDLPACVHVRTHHTT